MPKDLKTYIVSRIKVVENDCWEWQLSLSPVGYGNATYKDKPYRANRLSYIAFKGEIPEGMLVCHKCDNPPCCNPDHLFLGTPSDNMQDREKKKRGTKGRTFYRKYSKETCRNCFEMWKSGMSIQDISQHTDIHFTTVYYLIKKYCESVGFNFTQKREENKARPKFLKIPAEKCIKILSLRQDGKTFLQISQEIGVKLSTCKYICAHPDRLKDT